MKKVKEELDKAIEFAEKNDMELESIELGTKAQTELSKELGGYDEQGTQLQVQVYRGLLVLPACNGKAISLKMVSKYAFMLMLFLSSLTHGQTIAMGAITSAEPYEVYIHDFNRDGDSTLRYWGIWELYAAYDIKARPGQEQHAIFIGECTGDTTHLYVGGAKHRSKYYMPITLDGGHHYAGVRFRDENHQLIPAKL
jgi:hypothetical protein